MANRVRAFFISLSILALVLFSAFGTIPVYADDGTTSGSTETTTTAGTDPVATEQPTSDPSTASEEPQPPADGTTTEQPASDPSAVSEEPQPPVDGTTTETTETSTDTPIDTATVPLLEQMPDNTTVTVVNETGEAQPLVSQDSADAVLLSDPIWCPAGQAPTPGANGCTASYSSFTELLTFLQANEADPAYQVDGTIYVEQGAYAGGEQSIDFNSYNFTEINKKNLTVTGGWDPTDNSTDSTSTFSVPIIIGSSANPWGGSLTLNNLVINGATDQTGLTLNSQGNVELSNVEVANSQNGTEINAGGNVTIKNSKFHNNKQKGADITSGGAVDVSNSQFSDNGSGDIGDPTGSGLGVKSAGAVTLLDVAANNNQLFGSNIQAGGAVNITHGFFSGNQGILYSFNWDYQGYGLQVVTTGDITLADVVANDNYLFGASLDGAKVTIGDANLTTKSTFSNNGPGHDSVGYGLAVKGSDVVSLYNIEANNNNLYGANIAGSKSVLVSNSLFNGNQSYEWSGNKTYFGYGLQVTTAADIVLLTVSANGNYVLGAHLESSDTAIRDSSFSNNGSGSGLDLVGKGLEIVGVAVPEFGTGNVALRNVVADNNQLFGANIQTPGNVAINADTGKTNSFSGHITYVYDANSGEVLEIGGGYGLQVVAGGNIAIRNTTTTGNYLYGTSLDGLNVDITNGTFSNNGSGVNTNPVGYGLKVNSKGVVSLVNITANTNQLFGANIVALGNIAITTGFFSGHQTLVADPLLGLTFYGYGLTAVSQQGDVILDGVQGNFNNLWGASLEGLSVSVVNSQFNNNVSDSSQFIDDTGLIIKSHGVDSFVFLDNTETKNNRLIGTTITADGGVYIWNSTFTGNMGVTCSISWCPSGSEIYWGYGLNVVTPGIISLQNVNASGNNLFGANLQGGTVEVTGGTFNNNQFGDGLTITSGGAVTLTNVTASGNGEDGVDVTTPACAVVQVSDGTFTNNTQYGLSVTSGVLTTTGTQTFAGNGAGNIFQNPATCAIVLSVSAASAAPLTTTVTTNTSGTSTTLSAGTTTSTKIVTTTKKTTKVKKAVVKKHKVAKVRRHARRAR